MLVGVLGVARLARPTLILHVQQETGKLGLLDLAQFGPASFSIQHASKKLPPPPSSLGKVIA
jgi:hypothetical protein